MTDRENRIRAFLAGTDWAAARRVRLAGDASNRRYDRLTDPATGRTAVLMDAPPDRGEDVRPFVRVARHLAGLGFSAPAILAEDDAAGLLLLEDLGDDLFARVLRRQPGLERTLYEAATDVLVGLHGTPPPEVAAYDAGLMVDLACLAFTRYRAGITGDADGSVRDRFATRFSPVVEEWALADPVLVLRDYHAENLLWLPDREGLRRVGLLDFQDAMTGHRAYDLVSLLQDARRDVPAGTEAMMIARYVAATGVDDHGFRTAYAVLGVQRSLRILGVFARLGLDYGKPQYVDLIPRVWAHLMQDIDHPALAPVAAIVAENMPPPTPDNLARLRRP